MKQLLLSILILFVACNASENESPETPNNNTPNVVVTDNYKFISVNSEGGIFEIGNNTGLISKIGQIPTQDNLLMLSSIVNFDDKILSKEAIIASPYVIYEYNKTNNTKTDINLIIPNSVISSMNEPFLSAMTYNGNSILAVVNENQPNNTHPNKLISIDPITYTVTDLNISFYQTSISSLIYVNNKLYMSSLDNGLIEVDVNSKTVTSITNNIPITRLARIDNSNLAYNQLGVSNWVNSIKPYKINLSNLSREDKSLNNTYSLGNIFGNGYYTNSEVINLVYKQNNEFGLLKLNYTTNEIKFIALDKDIISVNSIIIDKKSL